MKGPGETREHGSLHVMGGKAKQGKSNLRDKRVHAAGCRLLDGNLELRMVAGSVAKIEEAVGKLYLDRSLFFENHTVADNQSAVGGVGRAGLHGDTERGTSNVLATQKQPDPARRTGLGDH
jgi:hypothetical protein